jgi:hypothetical protein
LAAYFSEKNSLDRRKNFKNGGAEEDRTLGLYIANVALSQLSYSPTVLII